MIFASEKQFFNYFYNLKKKGIKLDLAKFSNMLSKIGNPHKHFPSIHIAGTNGKGSTAKLISLLLQNHNYKTGLFISPHIQSFNERISINGKNISYEEMIDFVNFFEKKLLEPSFFEATTLMAFLKFQQENIDVAVMETGLGGRLDTTNLSQSVISVITSISTDHALMLTSDIENIAWEKSGIASSSAPLVIPDFDIQITKIIEQTAKARGAYLIKANEDFHFETISEQKIKWFWKNENPVEFEIPLVGKFQKSNSSLALAACRLFINKPLQPENLKINRKNINFYGRIEKIGNWILDGAHNLEAICNLTEYLSSKNQKYEVVIAAMEDKNLDDIIKNLIKIASGFHCTTVEDSRSAQPKLLSFKIHKYGGVVLSENKTPQELIKYLNFNNNIVFTGSFYLVGKIRNLILNSKSDYLSLTDPSQ